MQRGKPLERRTPLSPGTKGLAPGKGLASGTGLARGTALARTASTERRTPLARQEPARRPRKARVAPEVRDAVLARSRGLCEVGILATCRARGRSLTSPDGTNQHHRRPGGMGGSRRSDTHHAANLLQVCGQGNTSGCHGWLETYRDLARTMGLLLWQDQDPATTPARLWDGRRVLLTATGYDEIPADEHSA